MNHLMICSSLDKTPEELNVPVTVVINHLTPSVTKKQIEMKYSSNKNTAGSIPSNLGVPEVIC